MMHRGSLVIVTASHPVEKFDEGWPDIAKAFDTLLFTGTEEPDPAGRPSRSRADADAGAAADPPAGAAPTRSVRAPAPAPAPSAPDAPPKLAPAPPEWTREVRERAEDRRDPGRDADRGLDPGGLEPRSADDDATRAVQAFVAAAEVRRTPGPARIVAAHRLRRVPGGARGPWRARPARCSAHAPASRAGRARARRRTRRCRLGAGGVARRHGPGTRIQYTLKSGEPRGVGHACSAR